MTAKINIDLNQCNGCGICANTCFIDVIRIDNETKKPVPKYQDECVWCLECEIACPKKCIEVVPEIPGLRVAPW